MLYNDNARWSNDIQNHYQTCYTAAIQLNCHKLLGYDNLNLKMYRIWWRSILSQTCETNLINTCYVNPTPSSLVTKSIWRVYWNLQNKSGQILKCYLGTLNPYTKLSLNRYIDLIKKLHPLAAVSSLIRCKILT